MYLQSKPHRKEVRLIKELMLDALRQSNLPEVNLLHQNSAMRRNISLVSLLTDNSGAHDAQLAYFAKQIENTEAKHRGKKDNDVEDAFLNL